jgi:hypothetical protein
MPQPQWTHATASFVVLAACATVGCSSPPPPPHQGELVERFESQRATFTSVANWARQHQGPVRVRLDGLNAETGKEAGLDADEIAQLQKWSAELKIEGIYRRSQKPFELMLFAWTWDAIGPGGHQVSYVFREEEPARLTRRIESYLYPSLVPNTEIHQRLDGNWYLFYVGSD